MAFTHGLRHTGALSRRNFLKTTGVLGAAGALGALASCAPKEQQGGETEGSSIEAVTQTDQLFCGSCRAVCMQGALVFSGATERLRYPTGGIMLHYSMDVI